jgi:hypothetical protein
MKKKEMFRYFINKSSLQKLIVFLFACVYIFGFTNYENKSHAAGNFDSVDIRMNPESPGPQEEVTISLNSFSFNINKAETSVYLNNKFVKKAIGLKVFKFTTSGLGKESLLRFDILQNDGEMVTEEVSIVPTSVSLVYEISNPHTPSGYLGKSTAISNSALTIHAFPNFVNTSGKKLNKDSLVYTWYKNFNIEAKSSGFAKSTYVIDRLDAFPRETFISVKVSSLDGSIYNNSQIVFNPQKSEIEFYLLDNTMPFSFKNIANPNIFSFYSDTRILAVPYFMNDIDSKKAQYSWIIGGKEYSHTEDSKRNEILLVNGSSDSFVSSIDISLQINNRYRILQSVYESFSINFGDTSNNDRDDIFFNTGSFSDKDRFFNF